MQLKQFLRLAQLAHQTVFLLPSSQTVASGSAAAKKKQENDKFSKKTKSYGKFKALQQPKSIKHIKQLLKCVNGRCCLRRQFLFSFFSVFREFLTPDAAAIVRESMQTSRGAVKVANKIIIHAEVLSEMFDREL